MPYTWVNFFFTFSFTHLYSHGGIYWINDEIIYPYYYPANRVNIHHFTFTLTHIDNFARLLYPYLVWNVKNKIK